MSEVASRPAPARGRGSGRGGRGGARGSRGRDRPNGSYTNTPAIEDFSDQGELGEMKKQYSSQLPMLKELFSDWTDVDLLFALQETDGDLESTIERISEGHVSKFSDVKSTKEKSKPKSKDTHVTPADAALSSTRPSRGRGGIDASRGSRGRIERGRGGFRGGRGATHVAANGARAAAGTTSTPTTDAWDTPAPTNPAATSDSETAAPVETAVKPVAAENAKSSIPTEAPKKTWAQMFAKPPQPAAVPQKPVPEAVPGSEPGATPSELSSGYVEVTHADAEPEDLPVPTPADEITGHDPPAIVEPAEDTIAVDLTPSKDQLTKENVEHLPDVAQPAPTGTAASTVESSRGPDSVTPSIAGQPAAQPPIGRPAMGGFQTTAYKATGVSGRSASFNRRLQEQQEAVVMPGNHAVDRTAVQFGSLGLNGDALDVDEDREELETRAQPPQHSPVAAPRASLPPVPRQPAAPSEAPIEAPAGPKASTGLPPAPQPQQSFAQQSPSATATQTQGASQAGQGYSQFGRFGQGDAASQKPYDPFGQQLPQQSGYEGYPSSTQAPIQGSQAIGGFSSSAADYSSYYTADQRNAYSNYYNSYGQQNAGAQQDAGASQQRTGSAFGATADSSFPSGQLQQTTSRYGENTQSGHTTPNPAPGSQPHGAQPSGGQHPHQQPHGQNQYPGYAGHPYYNSPYYSAYVNQYSPYGQQGFGGQQFNKGGMYTQPHHGYGQTGYDQHSSSPANVSGFGRDTGLGGGLGEYGRTASAQPTQSQQASTGGFGGGSDAFGRAQGGFPGQGQSYGQTQSGQQGASEDALKPFGDSKAGPSPSALGQPGRPGSATNTSGQGAQTGLPPPQSHQHGFGGYPGQMGGTSQYGGGLGGLGGHTAGAQSHQQGGGGYGNSNYAGGFSNYGGSYGGRGGWGGNYGH